MRLNRHQAHIRLPLSGHAAEEAWIGRLTNCDILNSIRTLRNKHQFMCVNFSRSSAWHWDTRRSTFPLQAGEIRIIRVPVRRKSLWASVNGPCRTVYCFDTLIVLLWCYYQSSKSHKYFRFKRSNVSKRKGEHFIDRKVSESLFSINLTSFSCKPWIKQSVWSSPSNSSQKWCSCDRCFLSFGDLKLESNA